jgi:hypothetical protein
MTTHAVTALEVLDEEFLVASLIERCPKTAMIRELMMNALEAAQHAPAGRRLVEISSQSIDGVPKLAMWNTGPGMDAAELTRICNIASSIGKQKSLTGNFGWARKLRHCRQISVVCAIVLAKMDACTKLFCASAMEYMAGCAAIIQKQASTLR